MLYTSSSESLQDHQSHLCYAFAALSVSSWRRGDQRLGEAIPDIYIHGVAQRMLACSLSSSPATWPPVTLVRMELRSARGESIAAPDIIEQRNGRSLSPVLHLLPSGRQQHSSRWTVQRVRKENHGCLPILYNPLMLAVFFFFVPGKLTVCSVPSFSVHTVYKRWRSCVSAIRGFITLA